MGFVLVGGSALDVSEVFEIIFFCTQVKINVNLFGRYVKLSYICIS